MLNISRNLGRGTIFTFSLSVLLSTAALSTPSAHAQQTYNDTTKRIVTIAPPTGLAADDTITLEKTQKIEAPTEKDADKKVQYPINNASEFSDVTDIGKFVGDYAKNPLKTFTERQRLLNNQSAQFDRRNPELYRKNRFDKPKLNRDEQSSTFGTEAFPDKFNRKTNALYGE